MGITVSRTLTPEECLSTLRHLRDGDQAKGVMYSLTNHFARYVLGGDYTVSYTPADQSFHLTASGNAAKAVLDHERAQKSCWCLTSKTRNTNERNDPC
jgi:hypothetical protein